MRANSRTKLVSRGQVAAARGLEGCVALLATPCVSAAGLACARRPRARCQPRKGPNLLTSPSLAVLLDWLPAGQG